jgi:hypothetical protein
MSMDTLKGLALIGAFIGFLAIFATWVMIYEATWALAVSPTRANIYKARIGPSDCLAPLAWWWKRQAGCRLI